MPVVFKINYKDDIRRISLDRAPSYEELKQIVKQLFNIGPSFLLKYEDEEKDQITIASEGELTEALMVSSKYFSGILRLYVLEKSAPQSNEPNLPKETNTQPNPLASLFSHALSGTGAQDVATLLSTLQGAGLSQPGQQQALQTLTQLMTTFPWLNESVTTAIKQGFCPPVSVATSTNTINTDDKATSTIQFPKSKTRYLAKFIKDMSIMDGTIFAPNTKFTKTWRVRNDGPTAWPEKTSLLHVGGDQLATTTMVQVPSTEAGQEVDISVEMVTPSLPGRYNSFWRLCGPEGNKFGHRMWVDITVKIPQESSGVQTFATTAIPSSPVQTASPVLSITPVQLIQFSPSAQPHVQPSTEETVVPLQLESVAPESSIQQPELVPVVQEEPDLPVNNNDKVNNAPVNTPEAHSTTPAEAEALGTLVDMGFVGDLLSVLRKHGGDLMSALGELVGNH